MKREWSPLAAGELTEFLNRSWPGQDLFVSKIKAGAFEIRSWSSRDKGESFTVLPVTSLAINKAVVGQIEKILGKRRI